MVTNFKNQFSDQFSLVAKTMVINFKNQSSDQL